MSARTYVVRPGDYLTKIAARLGLDAKRAWDDDRNAELRKRRPNPEMLCVGDVLHLPSEDPSTRPQIAKSEEKALVARVPKIQIHLVLQQEGGPLEGEPWIVEGAGEPPPEGKTDASGRVDFEVPVHASEIRLLLTRHHCAIPVRVGHLDPMDEPSGLHHRLENLGYTRQILSGATGADLAREALKLFKSERDLGDDGEVDDATRDALVDAHGS